MNASNREGTGDLLVVWTSGDREVALKMVFMYSGNAKKQGWWSGVTLLIWGPSQTLLLDDEELQAGLADMQRAGVRTIACKACADSYGVSRRLAALDVEVFYTGAFLTDWIRSEGHVITF